MSLLGFLTGVGSLFGGGSSSNTDSNKSSATTASGSINQLNTDNKLTNQTQKTVGSEKTSNVGSVSTKTNESVAGSTNTVQSGKSQTAQSQQTTMYSSDILAQLDQALKAGLESGGDQAGTDALIGRLNQVKQMAAAPEFDVSGYVNGIAAAAGAATQGDLESRINSILSATGSSETGNSMSALLGNRLRNDATATLAGIVSQATAQGEQIKEQQQASLTEQIGGLANDLSAHLTNLLQAGAGARQETTGTSATIDSATQGTTSQQQTVGSQNVASIQHGLTVDRTATTAKGSEKDTGIIAQTQKSASNTNESGSSNTGSGSNFFDNLFNALSKSSAAA